MTISKFDIQQLSDINDLETGKRYLFWNKDFPDDAELGFSSKIENIGVVEKHDCKLKNKTIVLVLSEPIKANHARIGPLLVSKVLADKIMYVSTFALFEINEKE